MALDRLARRMLTELRRDSRLSVQDPANRVGRSSTPCWRRLEEIEKNDLIRRYTVLLDREALGLNGMSARACHAAAPCRADCGGVRACGTGPAGGDRVLLDHDGRRGLHPSR